MKRLAAAAYRDLLGISEPDTADILSYGTEEERGTERRRARGLHKNRR
jgi:hypothetical protein